MDLRAQAERAARRAVDLALTQYREGAVDYTPVLNTQERLVAQQDQLTAARGDVASNLISLYRALGGGWQLRKGKQIIPAPIRSEMQQRTNWGGLLNPEPDLEASEERSRTPDW